MEKLIWTLQNKEIRFFQIKLVDASPKAHKEEEEDPKAFIHLNPQENLLVGTIRLSMHPKVLQREVNIKVEIVKR